jgi:hypothetical protein
MEENMKKTTTTTIGRTLLVLALAVAMLGGCSAAQSQSDPTPVASEEAGTSEVLDWSGQLALGTLNLEETADAVTAQQAAALLPLWQAIRSGTLQSEAETDAVLKQIEGAMTSGQLAAIQAVQWTTDDLSSWAQNQGLNLDPGQGFTPLEEGGELPQELQERLREQFGGQMPSAEELEAMRAQKGNMSEEEREARRATAEAGGRTLGAAGAWRGQSFMILNPLIVLLTERAGA